MTLSEPRTTPLYDTHIQLGGRMVEYANWQLPVYYQGLVEEHEAVRNHAGIFDVSHMGEIVIKGLDAQKFVNHLSTNDVSLLWNQQIAYSLMCYPDGGVVDDILVYKYSPQHFLLVVNAANIKKGSGVDLFAKTRLGCRNRQYFG
jgi:aminomethyltransferase